MLINTGYYKFLMCKYLFLESFFKNFVRSLYLYVFNIRECIQMDWYISWVNSNFQALC